MEEEPLTCVFRLSVDGQALTVTISSRLVLPLTANLRAELLSENDKEAFAVATWKDEEWEVYDGDENSDPRYLIAISVAHGEMLQGPCCSDWPLVLNFLQHLVNTEQVWHR